MHDHARHWQRYGDGERFSVTVTCAAVTYSVGGTVVGLAGVPTSNGQLVDNSFVIQNVLGNTYILRNGPFTFATPEALNDQYEISVLHAPSTQPITARAGTTRA